MAKIWLDLHPDSTVQIANQGLDNAGDIDSDLKAIGDFYAGVTTYRPELTGPPSIACRPEDQTP